MSMALMTCKPNCVSIRFDEVRKGDVLLIPAGRWWVIGTAQVRDYHLRDGGRVWDDTPGDRFIREGDVVYLVHRPPAPPVPPVFHTDRETLIA